MNKELRIYIEEKLAEEGKYDITASEIIKKLDNHYDEALDFIADDLILCGEVDSLIAYASSDVYPDISKVVVGDKEFIDNNVFTVVAKSDTFGIPSKVVYNAYNLTANLGGYLVSYADSVRSTRTIQLDGDCYSLEVINVRR